MNRPFDEMDDNARIWIFQSSSTLPFDIAEPLTARVAHFLENWEAHGQALQAAFDLRYNRFLIVALDEASYAATGCSIDKLIRLIQELERDFKIELLNRMQIAFRDEGMVQSLPMSAFQAELESGEFDGDTLVFNNLIETKGQLNKQWEVPIRESWHKQWLPIA